MYTPSASDMEGHEAYDPYGMDKDLRSTVQTKSHILNHISLQIVNELPFLPSNLGLTYDILIGTSPRVSFVMILGRVQILV